MNRRNGNWPAPSINRLTATAVTDLAALSGYRSINQLRCIQSGDFPFNLVAAARARIPAAMN
jgi:hypothetical protein